MILAGFVSYLAERLMRCRQKTEWQERELGMKSNLMKCVCIHGGDRE